MAVGRRRRRRRRCVVVVVVASLLRRCVVRSSVRPFVSMIKKEKLCGGGG